MLLAMMVHAPPRCWGAGRNTRCGLEKAVTAIQCGRGVWVQALSRRSWCFRIRWLCPRIPHGVAQAGVLPAGLTSLRCCCRRLIMEAPNRLPQARVRRSRALSDPCALAARQRAQGSFRAHSFALQFPKLPEVRARDGCTCGRRCKGRRAAPMRDEPPPRVLLSLPPLQEQPKFVLGP